ncbi:hypothetical protein [Corallococcus aberystwythensis]|uniref:Uncharacterized protein n=1 Tax=Corallococcus aberystwythensis TaxID=2316722 RepID=A0A3A8QEA8_9BACT|nr:hypothetical protein [Corallococcus aberystwythensis]RKH65330.1 hypothetical protein D7W81_17135 [Corallococcus aberystwythensis]
MKTMSPQTRKTPDRKPTMNKSIAPSQQAKTDAPRTQLGSAARGPTMKAAAGGSFKAKSAPRVAANPSIRMPKK